MKKKTGKHLLLFLWITAAGYGLFSSCTPPSAQMKRLLGDSLEYITTTRYSSSEECSPDSQGCSFIKHQYPVFDNLPEGPLEE